jgi:hypothetical protein
MKLPCFRKKEAGGREVPVYQKYMKALVRE